MNEYTPEKVAVLAERTKRMREWQEMETDDFLVSDLEAVLTAAEDLTVVSAERDAEHRRAEGFRQAFLNTSKDRFRIKADRDRLHKAITEALATPISTRSDYEMRCVLRAALDQEGMTAQILNDFHADGVFRDQAGTIWVRQSEMVNGMKRAWDEGHRHCFHVENPNNPVKGNPYAKEPS